MLNQFTAKAGSLGPLIDLLSLEAQFADVLDILPHVSPRQALVEVFGMYDIAFKVGYFGCEDWVLGVLGGISAFWSF